MADRHIVAHQAGDPGGGDESEFAGSTAHPRAHSEDGGRAQHVDFDEGGVEVQGRAQDQGVARESAAGSAPAVAANLPGLGGAELPPWAQHLIETVAYQARALGQDRERGTTGTQGATTDPLVDYDKNWDRLRKLGAKEYTGDGAPSIAEQWLESFEELMERLRCTDEKKVEYATSLLQGAALSWWRTEKRGRPDTVWSWDRFLQHFRGRFLPRAYTDQLKLEFINLKQGNMTVTQYLQRFLELSKYAPEMIQDERAKCIRFEQGLRREIRAAVIERNSFDTLMDQALWKEEVLFVPSSGQKRDRGESSSGQSRWKRGSSSFPGARSGYSYSGFSRGSRRDRDRGIGGFRPGGGRGAAPTTSHNSVRGGDGESAPYCERCTKRHRGVCWQDIRDRRASVICFQCNQPGHYRDQCPQLGGLGGGQTASASVEMRASGSRDRDISRGRGRGRGFGALRTTSAVGSSRTQPSQIVPQARVHHIAREAAPADPGVISGLVLCCDTDAVVLIDPGSTHSFMSTSFAS